MTDQERIERAVRKGSCMVGPAERQRCAVHPRRWEIYRWTWDIGDDPTSGEAEIVRSCGACFEADHA